MTSSTNQPPDLKDVARAVWAAGDYGAIAPTIAHVGERAVRHAGIRAGEDVLDVACGTGNATLPAARAGARATGLDLTPELLAQARALAAAEGLDVEFVEGDAEALPFADAAFDAVLSTFGAMFAPDQAAVARELVRVTRPGGRIVLCNWTPEGETGDMIRLVAGYAPPPPGVPSPLRWGDETTVRELFAPLGVELELRREIAEFPLGTRAEAVEHYTTRFGPLVKAGERLQPDRWTALREDLGALYERWSPEGGDQLSYRGEYLLVEARRPG
jgi:ubiquinone/menaquinone biosynthesis C-methylase UbiE